MSRVEYNIHIWPIMGIMFLLVHVSTSVAFCNSFILERIIICTLATVVGLSGLRKLLLCLLVFLAGLVTGYSQSLLPVGLTCCLYIVQNLFGSTLVEHCNHDVYLVGQCVPHHVVWRDILKCIFSGMYGVAGLFDLGLL